MNRPLTDKVAIVTGAAEGIGAATARRLSDLGCMVMIHYNSRADSALHLAETLRQAGGKAETVQADLRDPDASQRIVEATVAAFGKIDILVNNAGYAGRAKIEDTTPAFILDHFQINTFAVFLLIQAALPHFPKEGGAIVNVTTNLCLNPALTMTVYSAAKAAVANMTLALAKELASRRITVNAVAPGATLTAMAAGMDEAMQAAVGKRTPLGRMGQPDDIAKVICFFATAQGAWVTGQSLLADGGFTEGAFGMGL
jgi:3-oxoacyl-[acyl-carrier protein] reductase